MGFLELPVCWSFLLCEVLFVSSSKPSVVTLFPPSLPSLIGGFSKYGAGKYLH